MRAERWTVPIGAAVGAVIGKGLALRLDPDGSTWVAVLAVLACTALGGGVGCLLGLVRDTDGHIG